MIGSALLALHEALRTYDPSRGVKIKTFARRRIVGELVDTIERTMAYEVALEDATSELLEEGIERDAAALACASGVESFVLCVTGDLYEDGETRFLRREARVELHRAVAELSPEERQIVELRYWEGLPWKSVAEALGLPVRTVQDHDKKLRASLKEALLARVSPRGRGVPKAPHCAHHEEMN